MLSCHRTQPINKFNPVQAAQLLYVGGVVIGRGAVPVTANMTWDDNSASSRRRTQACSRVSLEGRANALFGLDHEKQ